MSILNFLKIIKARLSDKKEVDFLKDWASQDREILKIERGNYYKNDCSKNSLLTYLVNLWRTKKPKVFKPTIIIFIQNESPNLERCLNSINKNTSTPVELLLINDACKDRKVIDLLRAYSKLEFVKVIENQKSVGFAKSINLGVQSSNEDVILLNSGAEVSPRWVENLIFCAHSERMIGTVSPITINVGRSQYPFANGAYEFPTWIDHCDLGRVITSTSLNQFPKVHKASGACIYIKRSYVNLINFFDEECIRICNGKDNFLFVNSSQKGWENRIDDSTLIRFNSTESSKDPNAKQPINAQHTINILNSSYTNKRKKNQYLQVIENSKKRISGFFNNSVLCQHFGKPTILYVSQEPLGNPIESNIDLAKKISSEYRILFFTSNRRYLKLYVLIKDKRVLINLWELKKHICPNDFHHDAYKAIVARVLINYNISIIHIKHFIFHTFDLPQKAFELNIPILLSLDDLYFINPRLIINEGNIYFHPEAHEIAGECNDSSEFSKSVCQLSSDWRAKWKRKAHTLFDEVDFLVTSSNYAKKLHIGKYPNLADKDFTVLPSGKDFFYSVNCENELKDKKIKILFSSNLFHEKEISIIKSLLDYDHKQRFEIHILGNYSIEATKLDDRVYHHGAYCSEDFQLHANRIKPKFIGIFSCCPEACFHSLAEAFSCGIPVLVDSKGSLAETINFSQGGWLVNCNDGEETIGKIYEFSEKSTEYAKQKQKSNLDRIRNTEQMSLDYLGKYKTISLTQSYFKKFLFKNEIVQKKYYKIGIIIPNKYASYYLRIKNSINNKFNTNLLSFEIIKPEDFIRFTENYKFDLLVIQRIVISGESIKSLLDAVLSQGLRYIYEIDDDLISINSTKYIRYKEEIKFLLKNALVTTVSSKVLKNRLLSFSNNIEVIPNYINEQTWGRIKVNEVSPRSTVNILYMGTKTHESDLELVLPALRECYVSHNIKLILIGISDETYEDNFIECRAIPKEWQIYPFFVRWLKSQRMHFDFGIAPLAGGPLNESKSMLKFLDYSALGIAGIFSKVGPYKKISNYQNGIVIENNNENWHNALTELIQDKELRRKIACNAVQHVKREHLLESNPYELYNLLNSMSSS